MHASIKPTIPCATMILQGMCTYWLAKTVFPNLFRVATPWNIICGTQWQTHSNLL